MRTRLALASAGVALGAFGAYQLLSLGPANLLATIIWLAGGVLLHDGVLALATLTITGVGALLLPPHHRSPLAAAFLVLATLTLTAIPVLGRFGARPDNPTLLDRNYLLGWLLLTLAVGAATTATVLLGARRRRRAQQVGDQP